MMNNDALAQGSNKAMRLKDFHAEMERLNKRSDEEKQSEGYDAIMRTAR